MKYAGYCVMEIEIHKDFSSKITFHDIINDFHEEIIENSNRIINEINSRNK